MIHTEIFSVLKKKKIIIMKISVEKKNCFFFFFFFLIFAGIIDWGSMLEPPFLHTR